MVSGTRDHAEQSRLQCLVGEKNHRQDCKGGEMTTAEWLLKGWQTKAWTGVRSSIKNVVVLAVGD